MVREYLWGLIARYDDGEFEWLEEKELQGYLRKRFEELKFTALEREKVLEMLECIEKAEKLFEDSPKYGGFASLALTAYALYEAKK
ncbi:MAG TPA: hypothetical protein VJI67_01510 [archaeon]|nr:hypothetical protein [archaeon]